MKNILYNKQAKVEWNWSPHLKITWLMTSSASVEQELWAHITEENNIPQRCREAEAKFCSWADLYSLNKIWTETRRLLIPIETKSQEHCIKLKLILLLHSSFVFQTGLNTQHILHKPKSIQLCSEYLQLTALHTDRSHIWEFFQPNEWSVLQEALFSVPMATLTNLSSFCNAWSPGQLIE